MIGVMFVMELDRAAVNPVTVMMETLAHWICVLCWFPLRLDAKTPL
jgi:hypothetical protein